jgi:hypothetical protein
MTEHVCPLSPPNTVGNTAIWQYSRPFGTSAVELGTVFGLGGVATDRELAFRDVGPQANHGSLVVAIRCVGRNQFCPDKLACAAGRACFRKLGLSVKVYSAVSRILMLALAPMRVALASIILMASW